MKKVIGAKNCTLQLNKQVLVYPPLEGGSKSLISGWGNNSLPRDKPHPYSSNFRSSSRRTVSLPLRGGDDKIKQYNGENDEHIFINTIFNIHATYSITICDITFVYKK